MSQGIGHLTGHMAVHICAMNFIAPLVALVLQKVVRSDQFASLLGVVATLQLALLWAWHIPTVLNVASANTPLTIAMHISLFAAAVAFWLSVFLAASGSPWRSVVALLLTGKIVCLLGVLLTFAPRSLYLMPHGGMAMQVGLEDQQMAGLLMLVACPLTYVFGATFIVARWLGRIERDGPSGRLMGSD